MSGAAHLPARLARVSELSEQLSEARTAAGSAVREALSAGETYRSLASRFGLSLGAVQRLAGKTDQPSRRVVTKSRQGMVQEGDGAVVTPPHSVEAPASHLPAAVCARLGCGAPAVPGKRCCHPHHDVW